MSKSIDKGVAKVNVLEVLIGFDQIKEMRNRIQNLVTSVCSMTRNKEWNAVVWEKPGKGLDLHESKDGSWVITFWIDGKGFPFIKEVQFVLKDGVLFEFKNELPKHTEVFLPPETTGIVYDNLQGFLDGVLSVSPSLSSSLTPFVEAAKRNGI